MFYTIINTGVVYIDDKIAVSKEIWLNYFNDYLYNNHLISHDEWVKVGNKILSNLSTNKK